MADAGGVIGSIIGLGLTALGMYNLDIPIIGRQINQIVPENMLTRNDNVWFNTYFISIILLGTGFGITYAGMEANASKTIDDKHNTSNTSSDKKSLAIASTVSAVGTVLTVGTLIKIFSALKGLRVPADRINSPFLKILGSMISTGVFTACLKTEVDTKLMESGGYNGALVIPLVFSAIGNLINIFLFVEQVYDIQNRNLQRLLSNNFSIGTIGVIMMTIGSFEVNTLRKK